MMKLGWMEKASLPQFSNSGDPSEFWTWLSEEANSYYLEFVSDAFWSSAWEDELRKKNRISALDRLAKGKDLDLVIAAGTWAGQDLANDFHKVPTIVISASNPIQSGIIKSPDDSGFPNVFAKVDPERYVRQLRLFHSLTKFKRLGVVYEDSVEGKTYAALPDIRKVASEKGFDIVPCKTNFSNLSIEETVAGTLRCIEDLAPKIDAFYITDHRGQTVDQIDILLKPLLKHKVLTWAQSGSEFVKKGVLFSTTNVDYDEYGLFYAKVIAALFNGKKLSECSQIFEDPKSLAINTDTAKIVGYTVPPAILNNSTVYSTRSENRGPE